LQKNDVQEKPRKHKVVAKQILSNPINLLAFGFGSGLAPKAPGTFGTLACVPLYWLLSDLSLIYYLLACFSVAFVGVYICGYTAKVLKTHDHPGIVWDEFAGFLITMIGVGFSAQNVLLGFVLFRIFDILKPWPINWLDSKVSGGLGIMLDDIVAGIFSMLALHSILYFLA